MLFDYGLVVLCIVCSEAKADKTSPWLGTGVCQRDTCLDHFLWVPCCFYWDVNSLQCFFPFTAPFSWHFNVWIATLFSPLNNHIYVVHNWPAGIIPLFGSSDRKCKWFSEWKRSPTAHFPNRSSKPKSQSRQERTGECCIFASSHSSAAKTAKNTQRCSIRTPIYPMIQTQLLEINRDLYADSKP